MAGINDVFENPLFNIGMGLLGSSGYSPMPKSLGQVMGEGVQFANGRQQQIMQAQAMRQALLDKQRQREAMTGLQGLSQVPQGIRAPDYDQQVMGLLADAAPEKYLGLLAGQLFPERQKLSPDVESTMAIFGMSDPKDLQNLTPQQQRIAMAITDPQGLAAMDANALEQARQETEYKQGVRQRNSSIQGTADTLFEAMDLNEQIADTLGRTGAASEFRNLLLKGQSVGDTLRALVTGEKLKESDSTKILALSQQLEQKLNEIPLDRLEEYTGGSGVGILNALQSAKANFGFEPAANDAILRDLAGDILGFNEIYREDSPFSESLMKKYQKRLEREYTPGGPGAQSSAGKYTDTYLRSLAPQDLLAIPENELTEAQANLIADILEAL